MLLLFAIPITFILLIVIAIKKPKLRSRILVFSLSMIALCFYLLSTLSDLTNLVFYFEGTNYFKAAKILTAVVFLYWYVKRANKNFFNHLKLLWIIFLIVTLFLPEMNVPKYVIYIVNILLLFLIIIATFTKRIRSNFPRKKS